MKRLIALVVLSLLVVAIGSSLQAQGKESTLYVKSFNVMRVYSHPLGYRVDYVTSSGVGQSMYVPLAWFYAAAGKAMMVQGWDSTFPRVEVYYKDGKFLYVKLYTIPDFNHTSWGWLRKDGPDISDKFNTDTLAVNF